MVEQMIEQMSLVPAQVMCGRHGEPFKCRWPLGFPLFAVTVFERLMMKQGFQEEAKALATANGLSDPDSILILLNTVPACCRIPPRELLAVYFEVNQKVGAWETDTCNLCGKRGAGSHYRKAAPGTLESGTIGSWDHVCLRCVCFAAPTSAKKVANIIPLRSLSGLNGKRNEK